MPFAEGTKVSIETSKQEIERMLRKYGATKFVFGWDEEKEVLTFEMQNRRVRFTIQRPLLEDFRITKARRIRTASQQRDAWEAEMRRRFRSLVLRLKAKLEAVVEKEVSFEEEFLSYIVVPNGQTVHEFLTPQLETSYQSGTMPKLLN
jgi:hypothetical protein